MTKHAVSDWDQLYQRGSFREALLYASLFWPRFIEIEGMVLVAEQAEGQVALNDVGKLLEKYDHDRRVIEGQFFVQIPYRFAENPDELSSDEDVESLARVLRETWAAKLRHDYPERSFEVEVLSDESDDPSIRITEIREDGGG